MRRIHRWISLVACLFLLVVGVTGIVLQVQSLTSADEAERERMADKVGVPIGSAMEQADAALAKARAQAATALGDKATIDRVEYLLRADPPRIVIHALKRDGSPVRFTARIADGSMIGDAMGEPDPRESFILRLHTGEVLGDAGVIGGILWGTSLVGLTLTGMWLYWKMYRGRVGVKGWRGILWAIVAVSAVALPVMRSRAESQNDTDDPARVNSNGRPLLKCSAASTRISRSLGVEDVHPK